jgi:hypothetical protein
VLITLHNAANSFSLAIYLYLTRPSQMFSLLHYQDYHCAPFSEQMARHAFQHCKNSHNSPGRLGKIKLMEDNLGNSLST